MVERQLRMRDAILAKALAKSIDAYLLADWGTGASCATRLDWPDPIDPLAAIDLLGWTGPIAFAETSARSCGTHMRFDLPNPPSPDPLELILDLPGSPALNATKTQAVTVLLRSGA